MNSHDCCRTMLSLARDSARKANVTIPQNLTALRADRRQFFVEMDGQKGQYVPADCSYEARAKFIFALVDRKI